MASKLFFVIEDIRCETSAYGNDVNWEGFLVNEKGEKFNDYVCIDTCEMASEPWDFICENDEDNSIIDEDGEIIDEKRYKEEVKAYEEMVVDGYYEMDEDYKQAIEIDGKSYSGISLTDFVSNHQIGKVGDFFQIDEPFSLDTKQEIVDLASQCYHISLGDWQLSTICLCEFEEDECGEDYIQGWLTFDNDDTYYTIIGGNTSNLDKLRKKVQHLSDNKVSLNTLIKEFGFEKEKVTGVTDVFLMHVNLE